MACPSDALATFHHLDRKFRRACQQIRLLNHSIESMQVRYDRAYNANRRSFRYTCRLQLASLEGLRNVFYEYASQRAQQLEDLQTHLIDAGFISDASDAEDDGALYWRPNRCSKQLFSELHILPKDYLWSLRFMTSISENK